MSLAHVLRLARHEWRLILKEPRFLLPFLRRLILSLLFVLLALLVLAAGGGIGVGALGARERGGVQPPRRTGQRGRFRCGRPVVHGAAPAGLGRRVVPVRRVRRGTMSSRDDVEEHVGGPGVYQLVRWAPDGPVTEAISSRCQ